MSIERLYIDRTVVHKPATREIQDRFKGPVHVVDAVEDVFAEISNASDPVAAGKQILLLTQNKGTFVKACPGTREYTCCGYQILNVGTFCTMDCAYCILQVYFHPPVLQYFVNQDAMLTELDQVFAKKTVSRIGTGELTDSLIWEAHTSLSEVLINKFARQNHAVLELKSKTVAIKQLKNLPHRHKTIMAWSLNTPRIIRSEERFTASLRARLEAAAQCRQWGYPLAFHFDPMIIYEGCEQEYRAVVNAIFDHVDADAIVWISLGALRFIPALKRVIERRFKDSKIVYGEFISGLDGKWRYFKPLRMRLFRQMVRWIKAKAPQVCVYLCMEDDEVWSDAFGYTPEEHGGLAQLLDDAAIRHCKLTGT